jgi:hypothetical protein
LRFVQGLLVAVGLALLLFAARQWARSSGFDDAAVNRAGGPTPPSATEVVALALLGIGALASARALQGPGGIRIPTPARLEELAGRAEAVAVERAEQAATSIEEHRS